MAYDGLAGYDPSGFDPELTDSVNNAFDYGTALAQQNIQRSNELVSKAEEKTRRLEQTRQRKERELLGTDNTDYGSDSWLMRKSKEYINEVLPHDYQIPVEFAGKQYNSQNKEFNSDDLTNIWDSTKENPNGDSVLYYMRKEDGYKDDGSKKWLYKPGIAKYGAVDRYKDQLTNTGWELIAEKRTNNAEQIENRIHGNEAFLKDRAFDYGRSTEDVYDKSKAFNPFGAGKSELYARDILGIDKNDELSKKQIEAKKALSMDNANSYYDRVAKDPDGRFGNLVDGLQSRSVSTVAGMADAVYDLFSDNEHNALNDWKDTTKTDKLFGYNATVSAAGLDKAAMDFDNGNYLSMLGNAFAIAPELIAESLPEMAAMLRGATGLGAITAMRSNDIMDEILENTGGDISQNQRLQAITAGTLMTALDRFGLEQLIAKNSMGKALVRKVFDNSSLQASKGIARKLIEKTAQLTVAGSAEAGTEMLQEITEAYGGKFGTKAEEELWNEEMKDTILKAGLGGFSAGTTIRAGSDVVQGVTENRTTDQDVIDNDPNGNQKLFTNQMFAVEKDLESPEATSLSAEDIGIMKEGLENAIDEAIGLVGQAQVDSLEKIFNGMNRDLGKTLFEDTPGSYEEKMREIEVLIEAAKTAAKTEPEAINEAAEEFDNIDSKLDELEAEDIEVEETNTPTPEDSSEIEFAIDGSSKTIKAKKVKESKTKIRYEYKHPQTGKTQAIIENKETGEIETLINIKTGEKTSKDGKKNTESFKGAKLSKVNKKTEEKKSDDSTPGPLKAFSGIGAKLEAVVPKNLAQRVKTAYGNIIKKTVGQRKLSARKSQLLTKDEDVVESFTNGSFSKDTLENPNLAKKQTKVQSRKTKAMKKALISKVGELLKSGKVSPSEKLNKKFQSMFEGTNEGGALRLAVIALNNVLDNTKSNIDVANNSGLEVERLYASRQAIAKEISRQFIASYGLQFVADGKSDTGTAVNSEHIDIGNIAIDMLEAAGYVTFMPDSESIYDVGGSERVDDTGKRPQTNVKKVNGKKVEELEGRNVIFLNKDLVGTKGLKANLRSNKVTSILYDMIAPIMEALSPGNFRAPEHFPSFDDIEAKGGNRTLSDNTNEAVLEFGSKPLYIKPETMDLLIDLANQSQDKTTYEVLKDNAWAMTMFGINDQVDLIETEELSTGGKRISRMSAAEAVIDSVKQSLLQVEDGQKIDPRELYFTYFSAINQRIHADEISFNFQADNFFARHVLSPVEKTYTTKTKEENEVLILTLSEELGLTPEEIMYGSEPESPASGSTYDGLNAMLQGGKLKNIKSYLSPTRATNKSTAKLFGSNKSPNAVIAAIQAVHAVRTAMNGTNDWHNVKIETDYAMGFDGNTSGLVNKLLNMLGGKNHDAVFELIKSLTVAEDGKLNDGYLVLANKVKELVQQKLDDAYENSADEDLTAGNEELQAILKFLEMIDHQTDKETGEISSTLRNTSKEPMMVNIYGQLADSLKRLMGFNVSSEILSQAKEGSKFYEGAQEILGMIHGAEVSPDTITYQDKLAMSKKIGDIIGDVYARALELVNAPVTSDSNVMYSSYDTMQKVASDLGQPLEMRNPFDVVYRALVKEGTIDGKSDPAALSNAYAFPIEKNKIVEVGETIIDSGSVTPTEERLMANPNSQKVMPLHAIDSAILLLAYVRTMQHFGKDFAGTMPVHDAVYSTPEFMLVYRKMYNEAAFDVAQHYDLINETLWQANTLLKQAEAQGGKKSNIELLKKKIAEMEALNNDPNNIDRITLKQQGLDELKSSDAQVFGTFKNTMPESGTDPAPKKTKPKKEVKKETKSEPKARAESKKEEPKAQQTKTEVQKEIDEINDIFGLPKNKISLKTFVEALRSSSKFSSEIAIDFLDQLEAELGSNTHLDTIRNYIESGKKVKKGKIFEYIPKTDTITIPDDTYTKVRSTKDVLRYIAHEIEHKATANYIFLESKKTPENQSKEYKYVAKFLDKLKKMPLDDYMYKDTDSFGENISTRIQHITDPGKSEYEQMAEFVAIYRTNEEFRNMVQKELTTNKTLTQRLIESIRDLVNKGMAALQPFDARKMTSDTLNTVMNNIVIVGQQAAQDKSDAGSVSAKQETIVSEIDESLNYVPYKGSEPLYFMPFESKISSFNDWARVGMQKGINVAGKTLSNIKWVQKMHKKQMKNSDGIYYKTAQIIKERFEPGHSMASLLTYMNLTGEFDTDTIRQLHVINTKAKQARNQVDTQMLADAKKDFDKITKNYSTEDKIALEKIFNSSLVHELGNEYGNSTFIDLIFNSKDGMKTIAELSREIEKMLVEEGSLKIQDQGISGYGGGIPKLAKDIASYYRTRALGDLAANNTTDHDIMRRLSGEKLRMFNTLVALRQLELGGKDELYRLQEFKKEAEAKNNDIFNTLMVTSSANYNLAYKVDVDASGFHQSKFDNVTGSHILFEENYEFVPVSETEFKNLDQIEGNEWIVLREPNDTSKTIGVVARIRDDFGYNSGIVSSTNLNSDGVPISNKRAELLDMKESNIIRTGSRGQYEHKIILTEEMLSKLEVRTNAVSTMFRSYGHNAEIFEGKSALNHILRKESMTVDTIELADKLEQEIKTKNHKPMFINFNTDILGHLSKENYPEIHRQYKNAKNLTNVLGFNKRVNMVHKNMESTMVGYTRDAFTDSRNTNSRKAESLLRNAVTMFASHVVMGNPAKIASDSVSNLSILLANNVPFRSMHKYGKEALKYAPEITIMRNELIMAQLEMHSYKTGSVKYLAQEKIVDDMEKEINKHPFAVALNNGFIQSLSTSMMMKDKESMSQVQKRANYAFNLVGDIPGAEKAIFAFSKFGIGAEDVLTFARKATKKGSTIDKELKYMANKLSKIKKEEDVAAYLSEIFAIPGQSELLRVGGIATLGVDVVSKWVLYKHTMDELSSNKKLTMAQKQKTAIALAVNSHIDYMTNLPAAIDMAKELGVWMFPHFILRVQKVIWGLIYNKAFGSGAAVATAAITGEFGPVIYGSAVPLRGIAQFDPYSPNVVIPAEVTNIPFY